MSIVVNALSYVHPDRESLFQSLDLSIATGEKVALVGNNGSGKSTLLQIIAGRLSPSGGEVICPEKPYYVPQHLGQFDDCSIAQALGAEQKLTALRAILAGDASPENFTKLNDDWDIDQRVDAALHYWQLAHPVSTHRMKSLSGGEKTKVFLAGILIHSPGILLLDEPSNHLDTASRDILYSFIEKSKKTILAVSHDRTLLNLMETTLALSKGGIEVYGGNYDFYREQKEDKVQALQAQVDESRKTLKQAQQKARDIAGQRQKKEVRGRAQGLQQSLPRILAGRRKSQAEQSTAKLNDVQAGKISAITDDLKQVRAQLQDYQALEVDLRSSELHRGKILIEATEINFRYGHQLLWPSPLTMQVRSGDRIRIAGSNGSGKTTLLSILTGNSQPSEGEIYRADFQYLYVDQGYSVIDDQLSVIEQAQRFNARGLPEHELNMMLHKYQFPKSSWDRKGGTLSGGERLKLLLCCLAISNNTPDLLILDEPTNNLDMLSQEILTRAVKSFSGSVLIISHDTYFIDETGITSTIHLVASA